jgi:hypothetical protein
MWFNWRRDFKWSSQNSQNRLTSCKNPLQVLISVFKRRIFATIVTTTFGAGVTRTTRFTARSFVWKMEESIVDFVRPKFYAPPTVSESESNFVRPHCWERSVGRKTFTLTPSRPFSHERTGHEPPRKAIIVFDYLSDASICGRLYTDLTWLKFILEIWDFRVTSAANILHLPPTLTDPGCEESRSATTAC